jgi:hypothetical protein
MYAGNKVAGPEKFGLLESRFKAIRVHISQVPYKDPNISAWRERRLQASSQLKRDCDNGEGAPLGPPSQEDLPPLAHLQAFHSVQMGDSPD